MGHSWMRPKLWLWIVIPVSAFTATPKGKERKGRCAKIYQNWARFDKVIIKIIWCIFFGPHVSHRPHSWWLLTDLNNDHISRDIIPAKCCILQEEWNSLPSAPCDSVRHWTHWDSDWRLIFPDNNEHHPVPPWHFCDSGVIYSHTHQCCLMKPMMRSNDHKWAVKWQDNFPLASFVWQNNCGVTQTRRPYGTQCNRKGNTIIKDVEYNLIWWRTGKCKWETVKHSKVARSVSIKLSLIHIWRCRRRG